MIDALTSPLAKELDRHPFTLLVVTGLLVFAGWSYVALARNDDVKELHTRIDTVVNQYAVLEKSITRSGLESQIANIEREVFSLTREIEKADLRSEPLPEIYRKRLSELEILRTKKIRELDRLDGQIAAQKSIRRNNP